MNFYIVRWQFEERTDGLGWVKSEFFRHKEAIACRKRMKEAGMYNVSMKKEDYYRTRGIK